MKQEISVFLLGIALFSDVVSLNAQVKTNYGHSADFRSYKTYSWLTVQSGDSLWYDRIKQDVDSQRAVKGWTKVDSSCVLYRGGAEGLTTLQEGAAEVLDAAEPGSLVGDKAMR